MQGTWEGFSEVVVLLVSASWPLVPKLRPRQTDLNAHCYLGDDAGWLSSSPWLQSRSRDLLAEHVSTCLVQQIVIFSEPRLLCFFK